MSSIRILLSVVGIVLLSTSAVLTDVINGLYVCNESGEHVKVAYATHKYDIWLSSGWTSVENEECQQLTTSFAYTIYYVYAVGDSGKEWGADHKYCIESQSDFDIPYADHTQACDYKRFFSVWIPSLLEAVFPDHYEVVIGPNNIGLNSPRAER